MLVYIYLLNKHKILELKTYLLKNIIKIILNSILMSIILGLMLNNFAEYLDYSNKLKSIYLILLVGFVAAFYLISCYLTNLLKVKI